MRRGRDRCHGSIVTVGGAHTGRTVLRVGIAGGLLMALTFGMARYAYGLTLPAVRADLGLSDVALGLIASGTFLGFLLALLLSNPVSGRVGPRATTTLGGLSAAIGCVIVSTAPASSVLGIGALLTGSAAGWVWAPYSDIAGQVARPEDHSHLLAWITTGAAAGLLAVGPLALAVSTWLSWRWLWAAMAVLAICATALNAHWVPHVEPTPRTRRRRRPPVRRILGPLTFAAVLFVGATAYFTYAADSAERGGLGAVAGPIVFTLVGLTGLAGLWTGTLMGRFRPGPVAACALVMTAASLTLLGVGSGSLTAVLGSALIFGCANTVGSAVLPIWTARRSPEQPAVAFSAALVTGSVCAVATPTVIGVLAEHVGLGGPLLASALLCLTTAAALVASSWSRSHRPG